jgi:hypothetical protein
MTKKLEELFNLPEIPEDAVPDTESTFHSIDENRAILRDVDDAINKIDIALPTVRDLDASDQEMDDLAKLATDKFEDLMDLGMNMDPRFGGVVFQTAGTLLGHAITAKTAKMDKKLRMVSLQLQKARLDHQVKKDAGKAAEDEPVDGQGIVLDRNALLDQILQKNKNA